ncbi:Nucleotidylyl transferase [Auricularia subglabra TFB-10046 SS5]|nr:Nucleotidylyl transferase [Auricularia subglabra TFB-10046 SS5]
MADDERRPTRLWLDGCFDGFHFAHANAVRQALNLVAGPVHITVGVHSDAEILRNKGPPLFDERERYDLIRGCRWVDQVVEDVPYVTQLASIDEHNIDYVVHGDDPVLDADGNDCYAFAKASGRYMECKRTQGISTTSLIDRILHPDKPWEIDEAALRDLLAKFAASSGDLPVLDCAVSDIRLAKDDRPHALIYGAWDCFGAGHIGLLRRARDALPPSSRLIVGVWAGETIEALSGSPPLLTCLERALALSQCRYVDAVVLKFPREPSQDLLDRLGVDTIVSFQEHQPVTDGVKVVQVEAPPLQTVPLLTQKVHAQLQQFEERQRRKGV